MPLAALMLAEERGLGYGAKMALWREEGWRLMAWGSGLPRAKLWYVRLWGGCQLLDLGIKGTEERSGWWGLGGLVLALASMSCLHEWR
jgi:hypothetical protein